MHYFQNNGFESEEELLSDNNEFSRSLDNSMTLKNWTKSILSDCEKLVEDGDHENAQYIPDIVPFILKSLELLPLWSNVLCKTFNFPVELASSAASEAGFNNIKNRIFNDLPCRVDDFVQSHLD